MDFAAPFLFLVWLLSGDRETTPATPARPRARPAPRPARPAAAPWPQVVPTGLPRFPGPGWEPDEPPPAAVQARAGQLLSQLWRGGAGTFKVEHTGARWLAYKAAITAGNKRGVVAYRLRAAAPRAAPPAPRPAPVAVPAPVRASRTPPRVRVRTGPAVPPRPPQVRPVSTKVVTPTGTIHARSPVELPTLRRGMGLRPQPPNEDVRLLQGKLGIQADGRFGSGTKRAVQAFQRSRRLSPDGIVGPNTWTALFAVKA